MGAGHKTGAPAEQGRGRGQERTTGRAGDPQGALPRLTFSCLLPVLYGGHRMCEWLGRAWKTSVGSACQVRMSGPTGHTLLPGL